MRRFDVNFIYVHDSLQNEDHRLDRNSSQTHFMLEVHLLFRLILYWARLPIDIGR
jgi:hypothetical protein